MEIRFLPSIHAKVYVADERLAVVTSANMTRGGLLNNLEYGIEVDDINLVRRIKLDITEYAGLGTRIDQVKLKFLSQISSDLNHIRAEAEKSVKSLLRTEFENRLKNFDEEIIRTRVA
jgi:phosphatidylserine/phosphatidylglycerophosphate/cardiolipin synthase-like enzyme